MLLNYPERVESYSPLSILDRDLYVQTFTSTILDCVLELLFRLDYSLLTETALRTTYISH